MIQRIQSVYLLVVTVLLVVAMCLPAGHFIAADGVNTLAFKPLGVTLADGGFQSTWGLFGLLLQVRMTIFNSVLLIGYYVVFGVFWYVLKGRLDVTGFQVGWALCLPAVCIILNYLAFRAIYRDEVMVKAADRLRPSR